MNKKTLNVGLIGKTNAGKSTLINSFIGEKISIENKKINTTLKIIEGIKNIKVIGAGSNILIRDGGFEGIVIKFGKSFSHLSLFDKNTLIAGASALDKSVSGFAFENPTLLFCAFQT